MMRQLVAAVDYASQLNLSRTLVIRNKAKAVQYQGY